MRTGTDSARSLSSKSALDRRPRRGRLGGWICTLLLGLGLCLRSVPAPGQDDARQRLLCAQLGGDLADPGEMAAFKRCLAAHAVAGDARRDDSAGSGASAPSGAAAAPATCSNCPSHDPNKPVPLGPGVNKGTIDNQSGPQLYYFLAGPGHVDVHYAFHEMGVFGNPYKQVLNFDILDEKNNLLNHHALESAGKLERFSEPGDLKRPYRLVIRVTSPDALIRLGGYFEIEAVGAVRFEGPPTGNNAKLPDTALVHPSGPLTGPPASLTGPPVSLTGPPVSLTGPSVALTNGTVSLYQPVGALTSVHESPHEWRLTLASDVLFDFGQSSIRPDAKPALDRVSQIVRQNGGAAVRIEGFTDAIGSSETNLRLSNARAAAVRRWLIEQAGLPAAGMQARGFGASHYAAPNTKPDGSDNPEGRQKNRRVEIVVQRR